MFRTIHRYEETGLGLPYPVTLVDSAEEEIDETGAVVSISVPDMEQLVISVALMRAFDPMQLSGAEVRFIRQVIGMNATSFAAALDLDKATVSRWENGRQQPGGWADKQVRQIAVIMLAPKVPCLSIDPKAIVKLRIQRVAPGYKPEIVLKRVPVGENEHCTDAEAWDMTLLQAA